MPEEKEAVEKAKKAALRYHDNARRKNIEGSVIIQFAVDEDGIVSDCTALKGLGFGCDEEALRPVQNMPAWTPGIRDGKQTKTYFTQSILFNMNGSEKKQKKQIRNKRNSDN